MRRAALLLPVVFAGLLGCPPIEPVDPGRVTLRRLNRVEYDRTVADLLGTTLRPGQGFPHDDTGHGFDTNGDVLAVSPLLLELLEAAARELARDALAPSATEPATMRIEAESATPGSELGASVGAATDDGWVLWADGTLSWEIVAPHPGTYRFGARLYGDPAGSDPVLARLLVDGSPGPEFVVPGTEPDAAALFELEVALNRDHVLAVEFLNDLYDPDLGLDRNLHIDRLELYGPLEGSAPNPLRARHVTCEPAGDPRPCARQILAPLLRRAWRRAVTAAEIDRVVDLVDVALTDGDDWDAALQTGLAYILTSPHFLYRIELDPDPTSAEPHPLTGFELASRLSYFLWSSMPDDALLELAEEGALLQPEVLRAQALRMLRDPRADSLVSEFAGQWLHIRGIGAAIPDLAAFPDFDDALRASLEAEMMATFAALLREDRSLLDLLVGTTSWVDARLAAHYGIEGVDSEVPAPIDVGSVGRGGVLTQGGLLTVLSFPARTSPVLRGKWILDQLLCTPPSPPPAGVEGLMEEDDPTNTLRERLQAHRSDPGCAACHATMDPLGFGLEHFDGVGGWRLTENGAPVDARGELPDGRSFDGARELQVMLAADPAVPRCIAQHAATFGLGRGLGPQDAAALDAIAADFADGGHRPSALFAAIAGSPLFTTRRGEP